MTTECAIPWEDLLNKEAYFYYIHYTEDLKADFTLERKVFSS